MRDIFSGKIRFNYVIPIFAVVFMTLSCSSSPRSEVETVTPEPASKSEQNKNKVIYFLNEVVGCGNEEAVIALLAPNCRY